MAVALAGMDPMRFLTTTDDTERLVMTEIAERVMKVVDKDDQNRAVKIANAIWGALKK